MKHFVCFLSLICLMSCQSSYVNVNVQEFSDLISGADVQLVDVRTAAEYQAGHIEGGILLDMKQPSFRDDAVAELSKDKPVAVYSRSGKRSASAAEILAKEGFNVSNLEQGILGWREAGMPVTLVRAVIITGQNNHNWPVSHQALKMILEGSGRFCVDIAQSPAQGEDFSGFNVDFGNYSLVVLDYNGDSWNEVMQNGFLDFVRGGGGVVIYHAADNAFSTWEEFNKIIALGGWENRDEKSGPYVYWQDGTLVRDTSAGPGGSHGDQHEYVMECRNAEHPVVKGLPEKWIHAKDELYDRMRGPGNIGDLLYTAYSPMEKRGSGRNEPLIFTVDYGDARIFHIMLGHAGETLENNPAMQCAGFQTLLLRGAEWAATGDVTQAVSTDFPTADKVSLRPEYK